MQVTPFGRAWEWQRSIWLGWLLFPFGFASFISFLYIGIRARRMKWIISSMIYFAITVVYFYISDNYDIDHIVFDTIMVIVLAAWITAWVQGVRARREYLRILANQVMVEQGLLEEQMQTYRQVYSHGKPEAPRPLRRRESDANDQATPTILNVNKATAEQLRTLPSIDLMSAIQIVEAREREGAFKSYTHLIQTLNVQPHVFAKAKPLMIFSDNDLPNKVDAPKKASEDVKQTKKQQTKRQRGRIVDY